MTDANWQARYKDRTDHPVKDADTVTINNRLAIKFEKGNTDNTSEFVGLLKMSPQGCRYFIENYDRYRQFHQSRLIEFLQKLTDLNHGILCYQVENMWFEIDTKQDYENMITGLNIS